MIIHGALVQGVQEVGFMKRTAILFFAALAVSLFTHPVFAAQKAKTGYTLTVLSPQGPVKKGRDLAPRLGTLNGKKIALWLSATADQRYAGRGAELYDGLSKMLKDKFPAIQIVPYADLPMKFEPEPEVVAAIAAKKPDAVIAALGG